MVGPIGRLGKAPHGRYERKAKLGPTPTTTLSLHTTQNHMYTLGTYGIISHVHISYIQLPLSSLSVHSCLQG